MSLSYCTDAVGIGMIVTKFCYTFSFSARIYPHETQS